MGIYQIDRVQYIKKQDNFVIFEFFKVNNLEEFYNIFTSQGNSLSTNYIDLMYFNKFKTINTLVDRFHLLLTIIIYDDKLDNIMTIANFDGKLKFKIYSYLEFNKVFVDINNIDGSELKSKKLGAIRSENKDKFVLETLERIGCLVEENDDNGLELTKKLLGLYTTKGFDFDLFQYIDSTGETIIYEFLKNETTYVTNYTANPMRYCWTGKKVDNKQKFISLWNVKERLNGRLYLINYSDNKKQGIGISEILCLDDNIGIRKEYKYNLTYDEFIDWMMMMNNYTGRETDYLRNYNCKRKYFDENFFDDWRWTKKNYY